MATPYTALRPLLFRTSAETAHHAGIRLGRVGQAMPGLMRSLYRPRLGGGEVAARRSAALRTEALGLTFETPVGIAAGLDKNGELIRLWPSLGLGFCEVGSVSARPSAGNPKPRAFRLPDDQALVNRMGLNNHGAEVIARRVAGTQKPAGFQLGINLAKTHDPSILGQAGLDDFVESTRLMLPHADFLVLNVSCPNTAEGKTFESPDAFAPLLDAVMAEHARQGSNAPVLVKLSPPPEVTFDHGPVDELVGLALDRGIRGFVATNTASDRAGLRTGADTLESIGRGGLSGAPLRERAQALVRHLFRVAGDRATIIGVGGIHSGDEAYERIRAGAHLVEVYTGLVYEGPALAGRIVTRIAERLEADGLNRIADAVGLDA